ncbi:2'-5' RNA ligase family protein [Novosphingobium sp. G106]|uniref:2'-5' RNA ligase family protein n=1 Tax=Novosphingobium sp. G106 TaxID=2849500 RepID=UPI0020C397BB|nr:2'-5' RNA ligase family protein [Novosphingobium sp. G106]
MTDSSTPAPERSPPGRGAPLLVTAELPADVFAWADGLRRAHYPSERNRLGAHVTLLHGLPPSAEGEVRRLLARLAGRPAPDARIVGLMDLGRGTALEVESAAMLDLHSELAEDLRGLIQQRDTHPPAVAHHGPEQGPASCCGSAPGRAGPDPAAARLPLSRPRAVALA